jgi:chromosome segregation ATPase
MAEALDDLRALQSRDAELASSAERLRALDGEVASLRARAEEIDAFFASYPETETRLRKGVVGAETELDHRRRELDEARKAVGDAKDEGAREAAERMVARVQDHVSVAEGRVARAAFAHQELEREAAALPDELRVLAARAARVAGKLPDLSTPEASPGVLIDWASAAHATLFVAAGQVDAQRERVVREANELATMLLGEPTYGSTPAQALDRVRAAGLRRQRP